AHDAQVAHPVFHIGDDIGCLGQHCIQGVVGHTVDQPAARVLDGGTVQPGPLKELHALVQQPPLGNGDLQPLAHTRTVLSPSLSYTSTISAPLSWARLRLDSRVRQGDSSQVPAGRPSTASSA